MDTFKNLEVSLHALEVRHLDRLRADFAWSDDLRACITGAVVFGVIDNRQKKRQEALPVVVAVGVNYTQEDRGPSTGALYSYEGTGEGPRIVTGTGSVPSAAAAISAYNRNPSAWEMPVAQYYCGDAGAGPYASHCATAQSGLLCEEPKGLEDGFILIMTNVSPFITRKYWQKQPEGCKRLIEKWSANDYLDDLASMLRDSVDLWIGHAAKGGTEWVWPPFRLFVKRNGLDSWLLTPNLSFAHLNMNGQFRNAGNALYALFGPEKRTVI